MLMFCRIGKYSLCIKGDVYACVPVYTCAYRYMCIHMCVEDTGCGCLPQSLSIFETRNLSLNSELTDLLE